MEEGTPGPTPAPRTPPSDPTISTFLPLTVRHLLTDRFLRFEQVPKEVKISRVKRQALWQFGLIEEAVEQDAREHLQFGSSSRSPAKGKQRVTSEIGLGSEARQKEWSQRIVAELNETGSSQDEKKDQGRKERPRSEGGIKRPASAGEGSVPTLNRKRSLGKVAKKGLKLGGAFGFTGLSSSASSTFSASTSTSSFSGAPPTRVTTPISDSFSPTLDDDTPFQSAATGGFSLRPTTPFSGRFRTNSLTSKERPPLSRLAEMQSVSRRSSVQGTESLLNPSSARRAGFEFEDIVKAAAKKHGDGKKRSRALEKKEEELMKVYRLVHAVIGCFIEDSAVVGNKLVAFDLLTLQPSYTYFDRPISSYHLPYLNLPTWIFKPSSTSANVMRGALRMKNVEGSWIPKELILDGYLGVVRFYRLQDSTDMKEHRFKIRSLESEVLDFQEDSGPCPPAIPSAIRVTFEDGAVYLIRPRSSTEGDDIRRCLELGRRGQGSPVDTLPGIRVGGKEEQTEQWRIDAVQLAYGSRHHQFDFHPSPRRRRYPRSPAPIPLNVFYGASSAEPRTPSRTSLEKAALPLPISPTLSPTVHLRNATPPRLTIRTNGGSSPKDFRSATPSVVMEEEEEPLNSPAVTISFGLELERPPSPNNRSETASDGTATPGLPITRSPSSHLLPIPLRQSHSVTPTLRSSFSTGTLNHLLPSANISTPNLSPTRRDSTYGGLHPLESIEDPFIFRSVHPRSPPTGGSRGQLTAVPDMRKQKSFG